MLNGIGYLTLLALLALPIPYFRDHPGLTHGLLIGYAATTFVLYFVINGFGGIWGNPAAIVAKTAEILLIVTTFIHWRAVRSPVAPVVPAAPAQAS